MRSGRHADGSGGQRFPALFVGGSALAHLALVAVLALPWPGWPPVPDPRADTPSTVEVVMVQQPARPAGQPVAAAPAPPTPAAAPAVPPQSSPQSPPLLPAQDAVAAQLPRPPAAPASPPPTVNLGGGDPSDAWSVHSDTIRPPAPDARFRNLPPRYPADAAVRGEAGTVGLVIHVTPDGAADGADVVESSGFPTLDREARRAVLLWHFAPARRDGEAVAFDYPFSIHFRKD